MAWGDNNENLPTYFFGSWSEDGTDITIPIASIPELTAGEADATTGDSRKTLFAICDQIFTAWNAIATADKPGNMTISKSISPNVSAGTEAIQYILRFTTAVAAGSREVVDEA